LDILSPPNPGNRPGNITVFIARLSDPSDSAAVFIFQYTASFLKVMPQIVSGAGGSIITGIGEKFPKVGIGMLSVKFGEIPGSILSMNSRTENVTWFLLLVPRLVNTSQLLSHALSVPVSIEISLSNYSASCIEPTKISTDGPSLQVYTPIVGVMATPSMGPANGGGTVQLFVRGGSTSSFDLASDFQARFADLSAQVLQIMDVPHFGFGGGGRVFTVAVPSWIGRMPRIVSVRLHPKAFNSPDETLSQTAVFQYQYIPNMEAFALPSTISAHNTKSEVELWLSGFFLSPQSPKNIKIFIDLGSSGDFSDADLMMIKVSEIMFHDHEQGQMLVTIEIPLLPPGYFNGTVQYEAYFASFQLLMENSTAGQLFLLPSHGPTSGGGTVKILAFGTPWPSNPFDISIVFGGEELKAYDILKCGVTWNQPCIQITSQVPAKSNQSKVM